MLTRTDERRGLRRYTSALLNDLLGRLTCRIRGETFSPTAARFKMLLPDTADSTAIRPTGRNTNLWEEHLSILLDVSIPSDGFQEIYSGTWTVPSNGADIHHYIADCRNGDHRFTFPLASTPAECTTIPSYIAALFITLSDILELLCGDVVVTPDSIEYEGDILDLSAWRRKHEAELGLREDGVRGTGRMQPLHSIAASEPGIVCIARHWAMLSTFIRLRDPDAVLSGFTLRNLDDWLVASNGHPSEVYEYLARVCNVACKFCYLDGNPSEIAVARGSSVVSKTEIATRLQRFDPDRGTALFRAQWELNEFLVDPKLADVLRALRDQTRETFFFVTNGSPLTPRVVELLREVAPVHLIVSLNTIDPLLRRTVMREQPVHTRTALSCLESVIAAEIPTGVSLVASDDVPLSALAETIRIVSTLPVAFVRVNLYGYTKRHPSPRPGNTDELWRATRRLIETLRREVDVPLIVIPSAFEENFFYHRPNAPRVLGTVLGSPARKAGLLPGDEIIQIGDWPVTTRGQATAILALITAKTKVIIRRHGAELNLQLDVRMPHEYPFTGPCIGKYTFHHGVVIAPSLSTVDIDDIVGELGESRKRAVVVTSALMKPAAEELLGIAHNDESCIRYVIPTNSFLGGNISVLDMCTVADISTAVAAELRNMRLPPNVIFLPSSGFNSLGRDIAGRHWTDLVRAFDVPVRLLNNTSQFLF